ncbi:MAG: NmrA protein [Gammaproteobacteria bacterium]|nr:NmrA protein [Gammaproteobacteria bacterium]
MKLLVTGANGNLAGAVIENLRAILPDRKFLAVGTRNTDSAYARQLAAAGITVRHLDFMNAGSVTAALAGIDRMLMISTYDPNDIRIQQHRTAIDAAVKAGVHHVIYTSCINADPASAFEHNSQVHAPTEAMIKASGLQYTFLRHNLYTEFLLMDLKETLTSGQLQRGGGGARIAFIGRDDLGVSAARVLAGDGHGNVIYTETGPEALSYTEAAAIMSEVFERPIKYVELTAQQWYQRSMGMGYPEPVARASMSNVIAASKGEFSTVSRDYEKITGRSARSVRQLLLDNKARYLKVYAA